MREKNRNAWAGLAGSHRDHGERRETEERGRGSGAESPNPRVSMGERARGLVSLASKRLSPSHPSASKHHRSAILGRRHFISSWHCLHCPVVAARHSPGSPRRPSWASSSSPPVPVAEASDGPCPSLPAPGINSRAIATRSDSLVPYECFICESHDETGAKLAEGLTSTLDYEYGLET